MVRENLRERFIGALDALGGSAGNGRLQAELGWQDDTYGSVHAALVADGTVVKGRGRGGSVSLASTGGARRSAPAEPPISAQEERAAAPFPRPMKANVLRQEAGCTTELDYTEQTSWMLFLKCVDDLEQERADRAALDGRPYAPIIAAPHRWADWAAPKRADGSFDHDRALTGDDLIGYVNRVVPLPVQSRSVV